QEIDIENIHFPTLCAGIGRYPSPNFTVSVLEKMTVFAASDMVNPGTCLPEDTFFLGSRLFPLHLWKKLEAKKAQKAISIP
uniref:Uncharacterized protein n=1 Tax=Romanomermis culicivorax TaxID=13658 RepID=A0A915IDG7_ROMCU